MTPAKDLSKIEEGTLTDGTLTVIFTWSLVLSPQSLASLAAAASSKYL